MLIYNSLFDKVTTDDLKRFYVYKGTMDQIIDELKEELPASSLIYNPTRLIKGLIDYKIQYPEKTIIFEIIRYVLELTKEIYSIHTVQQFKLTNFRLMLINNGLKDLLSFEVCQDEDAAACLSSIGNLTQKTAQKIYKEANGQNILLIPMAHGATAAGIDLLLRYSILSQNSFSAVYPCRFSIHKQKDTTPHLAPNEISYLKFQAKNKKIVVFEENIVTGVTLKQVTKYFNEHIFIDTPVISVTNLDISEVAKTESGQVNHEAMLKKFLLQYEDSVV
ncbi:MAG: hypothetical protein ABIO02_03345 [Patescibacteria group bacterium]